MLLYFYIADGVAEYYDLATGYNAIITAAAITAVTPYTPYQAPRHIEAQITKSAEAVLCASTLACFLLLLQVRCHRCSAPSTDSVLCSTQPRASSSQSPNPISTNPGTIHHE